MDIDGQCHCGRVSYRAAIDPEKVSICHCTDCQSLTGSPYRVTVLCSAAQIEMTGAPAKIYSKKGDNGRTRFQHFCEACGSPPFSSGEGGADDWGIRWGSIRQRDRLKPARQIWCRPLRRGSMTSVDCPGGQATRTSGTADMPPCTKGGRGAKQAA